MLNSNHVHSAGLSPLDEESPAVATDDTTPYLTCRPVMRKDLEHGHSIHMFAGLNGILRSLLACWTNVRRNLQVLSRKQASSHMRAEIEQSPFLMVMCLWKAI